jgi:hypothetical protein
MNTSNYFDLAEASYANLWDSSVSQTITSTEKVKVALKLNGFSESRATEFTTNWEVVSGGHQPNTGTGYSGTLFRRLTQAQIDRIR